MKILCCFGKYAYGRLARGVGVENAAFIPALESLGHEVYLFDTWAKGEYQSYEELNRKLVKEAVKFHPDIIFSVVTDVEIWIDTLWHLRSLLPHCRMISWATDDTWKYKQVSRYIACGYHGMVTTYADAVLRYHSDGVKNVHVSQWAANESWFKPPKPAMECRYPVSFVGIAYGDRRSIIQQLAQHGIHVNCFGHQWPAGSVATNEIPRIMHDSQISLNFSKGLYGGPNQIKARTFEVPGCGGFLLSEDAPGLNQWYLIGEEIDVWQNIPNLVERIRYYLNNQDKRNAMARAAYARTMHQHRYVQRMEAMVAWAMKLPASPVPAVNWQHCLNGHQLTKPLRYGRDALVTLATAIWGRERGWPYARRVAYEASWRLCRQHMFRSSGWFGRAFPPIQ